MHIDGKVKQILQSSIASVLQKSGTSTNVEINAAMISAAIYNSLIIGTWQIWEMILNSSKMRWSPS